MRPAVAEQGAGALLALGVALALLGGCGGDSGPEPPDEPGVDEPARLGCGEYCQQAGGYGGGSTGGPMLSIDTTSPVEALPDGTVPISMTCLFDAPCEGAVLLMSVAVTDPSDVGRSDLSVDANGSRTLAVPLSDADREALQDEGRVKVDATADLFPTLETLPVGERAEWNAVIFKRLVVTAPAP